MMKLAISLLSAIGAVSASKSVEIPTNDIAASSPLGGRILSAARQLNNNNNNNNNNNFSWISGYSIKFEKCATSDEYYGGYFGNNNNNKNNNNRQNFNGLYQQRLVHFKLCPTGSCSSSSSSSCANGADYVIDMNEFVDAYIDSKLTAQEYNCEQVRENCNCENANDDDACEYQ